jgi:hypothetical protein
MNAKTYKPWGYQATLGYLIAPKAQLLLRWDSFSTDKLSKDTDLFIVGYNYFATSFAGFQVNYVINKKESDAKNHQILLNAQISL